MGIWWGPKRFVSLAIRESRAFASALTVVALTLSMALFGALQTNTPAYAVSPPGNYTPASGNICGQTWQSLPASGFSIGDYYMFDNSNTGHYDAYDGFGIVTVGGTNTFASGTQVTSANDWVEPYMTSGSQSIAGLNVVVQDRFYANYMAMRQVISLTNPSASPISTYVQLYGNLGSDGSETQITSDGNTNLDTTDNWVVSNDPGPSDPVLSWGLQDSNASVRLNALGKSGDSQYFIWYLTIPANTTKRIMTMHGYAGVNSCANTRAAAVAAQSALWPSGTAMPSDFKSDLSSQVLSEVVNWGFAPGVSSFSSTQTSPTNQSTLNYNLTLSQSVSDLTLSDFDLTNSTATGCSIQSLTGSGTTYSLSVTGCSEGNVVLNLKPNSVTGVASQTGPAALSPANTVIVDRGPPTVALVPPSPTPNKGPTLNFQLTSSEVLLGSSLTASDFTVTPSGTGCVVGTPTGTNSPYTIPVSSCPSGSNVSLTLNALSISDSAGNNAPSSAISTSANAVLLDTIVPTATWVAPTSPSRVENLSFTLTASETVQALTSASFTAVGSGCTIGTVNTVGLVTTVTLTSCTSGVNAGVSLKANALVDLATNAGPASAQASTTVVVDALAPTVSTVAAKNTAGTTTY